MNLLFDLKATQPNESGKRHGGGRYGEVIFFRMAERGIAFSCVYDSSLWFNPDVKDVIEKYNIPLIDCANKSLQSIVDENKFDNMYSCCALRPEVAFLNNCQVCITVHDTRRFRAILDRCFWDYKNPAVTKVKYFLKKILSGYFDAHLKQKFRKQVIDTNLRILTVSDYTKYALECDFPEYKSKNIPIFYSPSTSDYVDMGQATAINNNETADGLYFLAVSGNRFEKNNARAIKAFDLLVDRGLIAEVRMKVTGATRENFMFKIKHPEVFDFLGYVSNQELEELYKNAYLFVYPSLNEGFGYPPLEAMHYRVPVIASPITSISDICDSGAIYFNPFSVEEIMNRMLMMMDPERHAEFAERGYQQYLKIHERQVRDLDGVIDFIMKESEADCILDGGGQI